MLNKLVITGIENGKISYVEGEVVEITVESVVERIKEIDEKVNGAQSNLEVRVEAEKSRVSKVLEEKKAEVEEKKNALDLEYSEFEKEINKSLESTIEDMNSNFAKEKEELDLLIKERSKLKAILLNVKSEWTDKVEQKKEEEKLPEEVPAKATETRAISKSIVF